MVITYRSLRMGCVTLALLLNASTAVATGEAFTPAFRVQTALVPVAFDSNKASVLAFAGRDRRGGPMLGLIYQNLNRLAYREIALPADTVGIDVGPSGAEEEALYVLASDTIYGLFDSASDLVTVARTESLYRGRSFAELRSGLDFARDVDGDAETDFVIPDFDLTHVLTATGRSVLSLPSYRRAYDQTVAYRPPPVTAAPGVNGGSLYAVRGNTLQSFSLGSSEPETRELPMRLNSELEREAFYNSYEDIDQTNTVLRELDQFVDVNGDGLPDIVTLETLSEGVFDKTTTYRVHHGHLDQDKLAFDAEADTTLSSRGFQLGARIAELDASRKVMVTASVQVGVRAIIGALFSRSVTMRLDIYSPATDGTVASEPSTELKGRVRFDFGSGQVEFPTITFGDIDGDGINDLILKERKRALNWRRGNSDGRFDTRSSDLDIVGPADGSNVVLSDLTGDGRDEIVVLYGRADGEALAGTVSVFSQQPSAQ